MFVIVGSLAASTLALGADRGADLSNLSNWGVTSHKVDLLEYHGGSGDIQYDQNTGWIYLGANHLEGGDIQYEIPVGRLNHDDILEVWIDGFSTSNDLHIGPTVFVGTGKNRYEQITRITGDAWRPFVFRFADDALYGDVTDPSNRNENWRIRYPSSKYEARRIDKAPTDLLAQTRLPLRISMTGPEDFIIKRIEVVVYRAAGGSADSLYIVKILPATVRQGEMVTVHLSDSFPAEDIDFYIVDPSGHDHKIVPRILNAEQDRVGFYAEGAPFRRSGQYEVKLVARTDWERDYLDVEPFAYRHPSKKPAPQATPEIQSPAVECPPSIAFPSRPYMPGAQLMPVPTAPPATIAPSAAGSGYTIQIGAFRHYSAATAMRDRLRREGYEAYIREATRGGSRLFRVRVGRYANKGLAQRDASRLQQRGFDTWVTELS